MSTCRSTAARLTDYSEGALSSSDKAVVDTHLDGCDGCRVLLADLRVTEAAMRGLSSAPSASREAALMSAFSGGERSWRHLPALALGVVVLAVCGWKAPGTSGATLSLAGFIGAAAVGLAALGGRAAALGSAVALGGVALWAGKPGPLPRENLFECGLYEVGIACVPLAVWLWATVRGRQPLQAIQAAGIAGAGALGGHAILAIACPVSDSLAHLRVAHGGGLALAMLVGVLATEVVRRRLPVS
jgi:hypothetical protein